ncbi:hypothetical protein HYX11_00190 [Candidatus Woesearchaeota archaeon]|nr:hypothetical protein [Candidatus Woesearchaeota archaeon]
MTTYEEHEIKTPITTLITVLKAAQSQAKITFLGLLSEYPINERFQNAITLCNIIEKKLRATVLQKLAAQEAQILFLLRDNLQQLITKKDFALLELEINKNKPINRTADPHTQQEIVNLARCKEIISNIQTLSKKIINQLVKQNIIEHN